jgi:hypothetical protein
MHGKLPSHRIVSAAIGDSGLSRKESPLIPPTFIKHLGALVERWHTAHQPASHLKSLQVCLFLCAYISRKTFAEKSTVGDLALAKLCARIRYLFFWE